MSHDREVTTQTPPPGEEKDLVTIERDLAVRSHDYTDKSHDKRARSHDSPQVPPCIMGIPCSRRAFSRTVLGEYSRLLRMR